MISVLIALLIGILAGIASGFFGIGGGIIIVPLLTFLMSYSLPQATATSLLALILPVGILAVLQYYQAGHLGPSQLKTGLLIAAGIVLGAFFGARMALHIPVEKLRLIFALLLVVMAAKLAFFSR